FCIAQAEPFLAAVLNSSCAWWFLRQSCTDLQNGYLQALLANQEPIPIPNATNPQKDVMNILVRGLVNLTKDSSKESESLRRIVFWERLLDGLMYELYFPEQVYGIDVNLFSLVQKLDLSKLPVRTVRESAKAMSTLCDFVLHERPELGISLERLRGL